MASRRLAPVKRGGFTPVPLIVIALVLLAAACAGPIPPTSAPAAGTPVTVSSPAAHVSSSPVAGFFAVDQGLGEPMDPTLGNLGYDVSHYEIDIAWDPVTRTLDAHVTVTATATVSMDTVNLDFIGFQIDEVTVDGARAEVARTERDIRVRPIAPLAAGRQFSVSIHYHGTPQPFKSASGFFIPLGWNEAGGTEYVVSEPDGARAWFPCNDVPSDKATFTFRLTVPRPLVAAANGRLVDTVNAPDRATWVWEMDDPMAAYLATVVIGHEAIVDDPTSSAAAGVPVRNVLPTDSYKLQDSLQQTLVRQGDMIAFFSDLFGPYPFDASGVAVVPGLMGSLEGQTLIITGALLEGVLAHEVAHQWFGDDVSVAHWQDIWLNEGFATYAEWLWEDHRGRATLAEEVAFAYDELLGHGFPPPGSPAPGDLFSKSVADRGALTLQALRVRVGSRAFFLILRAWVERYGGRSVSTEDFI